MIMSEAGRRVCMTRAQQVSKPGRQIVTFLLFANITLWVLDTFMSNREITQVHRGENKDRGEYRISFRGWRRSKKFYA